MTWFKEDRWLLPVVEGGKLNILYFNNDCDCCRGLVAHIPEMQRRDWNDAIDAVLALFDPDDDGDAYRDPDGIREKIAALRREKA